MELLMRGYNYKFLMIYIDDILCHSGTFEDHLKHQGLIFERIKSAGLTLKPTKCKFAMKEIPYLGYIIAKDGLRPDPEKCRIVKEYPEPRKM
jgi:hypothetical protein